MGAYSKVGGLSNKNGIKHGTLEARKYNSSGVDAQHLFTQSISCVVTPVIIMMGKLVFLPCLQSVHAPMRKGSLHAQYY